MKLSQLLEEKRKAKKRQAMAKTAKTVGVTAVVGASIGAIGGVLFAPKSGKETREDLKNSAITTNEKIKVKAGEAKTAFTDKFQSGKENVSDASSKIKEYLKSKKSNSNEEALEIEATEVSTTEESEEKDIQA